MAQGKKYSDELKEKAIAMLACNNASFVAEKLGLPYSTVKTWELKALKQAKQENADKTSEKENITPDEVTKSKTKFTEQNLVALRQKKKEEFVENAWGIIGKAQTLLERRLDRALNSEDTIDAFVKEIEKTDSKQLSAPQKKALCSRISAIKVESVKEIAVVLGTLYDKQALANKEATAIVEGQVSLKKFEDY